MTMIRIILVSHHRYSV